MEHLNADEKANKIGGFHAALNNDNVSEEAKQHAREQLKALGDSKFDYEAKIPDEQDKNPGNVAGGLKAAMHNPNVSEEGKESAERQLKNM